MAGKQKQKGVGAKLTRKNIDNNYIAARTAALPSMAKLTARSGTSVQEQLNKNEPLKMEQEHTVAVEEEIDEVVEEKVLAKQLNEGLSLILTATQSFTDVYGMKRKAGEEWMITHKDASSHILDVYEKIN